MSDTRSEVKVGVDQINNTDVIYYDNTDKCVILILWFLLVTMNI